jgi:hypothetical protein
MTHELTVYGKTLHDRSNDYNDISTAASLYSLAHLLMIILPITIDHRRPT